MTDRTVTSINVERRFDGELMLTILETPLDPHATGSMAEYPLPWREAVRLHDNLASMLGSELLSMKQAAKERSED